MLFSLMLPHVAFAKQCNVLDYGAVGDGKTLDTTSIQNAIDTCSSPTDELNTILFPSSYNFLTYPFKITHNNTELQIDATITCPMDYHNWPLNSEHQYQSLITLNDWVMNNIKISGKGTINGNGYYWYPLFLNDTLQYMRPCLIGRCWGGPRWDNAEISGITLLNSPMYFMALRGGTNITIHDINITLVDRYGNLGNYSVAPNTDGIDIGGNNIHVYNCYVQNGDDSFTLESGSNNVLIENSTCAYGLGLGIPMDCTQNTPYTINSVYRNIIVYKTWWGIRIKACGNVGNQWNGTVYNITYQNITFVDVKRGIDINVYNQSEYATNVGYSNVSNVVFENIRGTYTDWVGHLDCSDSPACTKLQFKDIYLENDGGADTEWQCSNNVYGKAVNVTPPLTCLNIR